MASNSSRGAGLMPRVRRKETAWNGSALPEGGLLHHRTPVRVWPAWAWRQKLGRSVPQCRGTLAQTFSIPPLVTQGCAVPLCRVPSVWHLMSQLLHEPGSMGGLHLGPSTGAPCAHCSPPALSDAHALHKHHCSSDSWPAGGAPAPTLFLAPWKQSPAESNGALWAG